MNEELAKVQAKMAEDWDKRSETAEQAFSFILDGYHGSAEDFYRSGRTHVRDLQYALKRFGVPPLHGVGVEVGCGAGRMTLALSECFEHLYALDVSQNMIALCPALPNVEYLAADEIPPGIHNVDYVVSHIVFQHMPKVAFWRYVVGAYKSLRPGGIFHTQLPFSPVGYDLDETETLFCRGYDFLELARGLPDERWEKIAVLRQCGLSEPWYWLTLRKK